MRRFDQARAAKSWRAYLTAIWAAFMAFCIVLPFLTGDLPHMWPFRLGVLAFLSSLPFFVMIWQPPASLWAREADLHIYGDEVAAVVLAKSWMRYVGRPMVKARLTLAGRPEPVITWCWALPSQVKGLKPGERSACCTPTASCPLGGSSRPRACRSGFRSRKWSPMPARAARNRTLTRRREQLWLPSSASWTADFGVCLPQAVASYWHSQASRSSCSYLRPRLGWPSLPSACRRRA